MRKKQDGWHPTSHIKYPKEGYYINVSVTDLKMAGWDKIPNTFRSGYKSLQTQFAIDEYCNYFEDIANIKIIERRLQEHYERSLFT